MITWSERIANLTQALGRNPTLEEMIDAAQIHQMTPEEIDAQRQSWVRDMTAGCEHDEVDSEQCPKCRGRVR
jgi:hypothetical protein